MPSSSTKQRNYIFYLRGKYKNKSNTPSDQMWIWNNDWTKIKKEGYMKKYVPFFTEEKIVKDGYKSPEPGDLSAKGKDILSSTYASCRKKDKNKTKCSKIAWSAVKKAGEK